MSNFGTNGDAQPIFALLFQELITLQSGWDDERTWGNRSENWDVDVFPVWKWNRCFFPGKPEFRLHFLSNLRSWVMNKGFANRPGAISPVNAPVNFRTLLRKSVKFSFPQTWNGRRTEFRKIGNPRKREELSFPIQENAWLGQRGWNPSWNVITKSP